MDINCTKIIKLVFLCGLLFLSASDCDKDCYADPNLIVPNTITASYGNVELLPFINEPVFIGQQFYPLGNNIILYAGFSTVNRFFSLRRTDLFGNPITFFWNEFTPPPFFNNAEYPFFYPIPGEKIKLHMVVYNDRFENITCILKDTETVESVLDYSVVAVDGVIVGEKKIIQKVTKIPAGKNATFSYEFEYQGNFKYNFNINFSAEGITEIDTTDNNYSASLDNLGF